MKSLFRCICVFLRMNDKRLPKMHTYNQFQVGIYGTGNLFSVSRTNWYKISNTSGKKPSKIGKNIDEHNM